MVAAYNSNSVEARNLLSATPRDDILVETMPCIARVEVNNAFFASSYNGAKGVVPPVMHMNGTVSSFFIESDDDRVFPCGEKEIQLMSPESVSIEYSLNPEEISSMALKGMFHDPDFDVPGQLVGNMIEIPLNITYTGIYETPCCFVEIVAPLELTTSTQDNNYWGLFETCPVSPVIEQIKNRQYDFAHFNEERHLFRAEEAMDYTPEEEVMEGPALSEEEQEDENIMMSVTERMMAEAKAREERAGKVARGGAASQVLYQAKEDFEQHEAMQAQAQDNSYQMYGYGVEQQGFSTIKVGPSGKDRTEALYSMLRTRAAESVEQEKSRLEQAGDEEREYQEGYEAGEDQTLQEEGFVDFTNVEGSLDDGASGKSQKEKAAAAAKKQQLINRQVDRAQDLMAMNMGITDTAGFGVPTQEQKPVVNNVAQNLLSRMQGLREKQAAAMQAEVVTKAQEAEKQAPEVSGQFL